MTSGVFRMFPIDEIIVNRDERQRRDLGDLTQLIDSIRRVKLMHPIIITRDGVLVTGECRLTACKSLGHTEIPVQFEDEDVDPEIRRVMELEENLTRTDLPWQDQLRQEADYHAYLSSKNPRWTQADTAALLKIGQQSVSKHQLVARHLDHPAVRLQPGFSDGYREALRIEKELNDESLFALETRSTLYGGSPGTPKAYDHTSGQEPTPDGLQHSSDGLHGPDGNGPAWGVLCADFTEWAPRYEGPRFNFVHCDFPYGIGSDKSGQNPSGYLDAPVVYEALCHALRDNLDRLVGDSAHIMFWFPPERHQATLDYLGVRGLGFTIEEVPLIWHKSDNRGIVPDVYRRPRRVYESAFFGWRGNRTIEAPFANLCPSPSVDGHVHEKPEPMLAHFFKRVVGPTTRMLDPTCGSGAALAAALGCGARFALGLELDEAVARRAHRRLGRLELPDGDGDLGLGDLGDGDLEEIGL